MKRDFLRTRDAALVIGVTTDYIYQEIIKAKRLQATIVPRPPSVGRQRGQNAIRIYPSQFALYLKTYWPDKLNKWNAVKDQWAA